MAEQPGGRGWKPEPQHLTLAPSCGASGVPLAESPCLLHVRPPHPQEEASENTSGVAVQNHWSITCNSQKVAGAAVLVIFLSNAHCHHLGDLESLGGFP